MLSPGEFIGKRVTEVLPAALARQTMRAIEQVLATGQMQIFEFSLAVRGRDQFYEARLAAIEEDGLLMVIRNITKRQQAEIAGREQRVLAEALRNTAETLNSTLNFDELLDRILINARRVVPYDLASIALVDGQTGSAQVVRIDGYAEDNLRELLMSLRFPIANTPHLSHVANSGQTLILADTHTYPGWTAIPGMNWVRSYAGAPIRMKGQLLGFIELDSATPSFFTATHAERLQAFANQVAIAIANIRLYEAERRQFETAEALRDTASALNSTLDFEELLERILINAQKVMPHDAANIMLIDQASGAAQVARCRGYDERGLTEWIMSFRFNVAEMYSLHRMVKTGEPLIVSDTQTYPHWVHCPEMTWLRSYAGVPIRIDDQVVGFLNLDSAMPDFFKPAQATSLRAFADQVAIAIRNARSFEKTRRNVERLTRLQSAGVALARTESLRELQQEILNWGVQLIDAQTGALLLSNESRDLVIVAVHHLPDDLIGQHIPIGQGLNGRAAHQRKPLQTANYSTFKDQLHLTHSSDVYPGALIAIPLVWQDRLVGTLSLSDQRLRKFDDDDLHTLNSFAALAAAAIEQRRAVIEAQQREAEAHTLTNRLANAQEEERSRLALQLHDTIGYQLVTIQKTPKRFRKS